MKAKMKLARVVAVKVVKRGQIWNRGGRICG